MKRTIRVKRHCIRDLLAFISGGALVASVLQKSWISLTLSILNGIVLFIEERADIEEEEQ